MLRVPGLSQSRNLPDNNEKLRRGDALAPTEVRRLSKDGRIIDALSSMSPIRNEAREIVGAAIILRDMSVLRQAEAQLRLAASVVDNAVEGIMITDRDNNILSVNPAFTQITGYAADEAIGKNPRLLSSGAQTGKFYDEMWATIKARGRWQGELWDRRKSGESYCESLSVSAVLNEQGEVSHYCGIFADITQRKRAETQLAMLNAELEMRIAGRTAELEAANRELSSFSYTVAHDLRAPLRAINGFSAMVLKANEGKLDQASVNDLNRVRAASARMADLIDDLLDLTRLSRQEMRRQDFNLSKLIATVVAALTAAHPERDVRVTIQPDLHVHGDRGLMRIVLENLIGNAWKFTANAGAARIEIGTEQRDGKTVYYVRDNGAGFDMEYAHKLFAPFQRLHRSDEFEGTGIGLVTVKTIIQRHGGEIWIESAVNLGTAVFFTIGKSA